MAGQLLKKYQLLWFNDGREEGREEGSQEKSLSVATAMLENNLSPKMIMKCTGLSEKELRKLQKKCCN